ncbi:DUF6731 family protein [Alkaliphilus sp. B6464]|uniref:DUF6731 family protein n=1 Tax=Alkaliphilus sp. B6464 TaxID=2731219 RepID=UPI001BA61842|nr:DUF6731 family protein [Alkaliphilus sp. B6464]QUH21432.1 hypothetical protein HYG84_17120 [Alkaliphilus sp. B6464]
MSKTINFFNVAIFKNGEKTDLDFLKFIDQIACFPWECRVRNLSGNISALFPLHLSELHKEKRIIPIGKFRTDYKPFLGKVTTSDLREIQKDLDVVELVTMVYDQKYRTAVLDYNQNGLKPKNIEEYFTSFIHRIEGIEWAVKLIPVISKKGIENIEESMQIRQLEIKLKLDKYSENIIARGVKVDDNNSKLILDVLSNFRAGNTSLDANTLKLEFNLGQNKTGTMNLETVKHLTKVLNLDSNYIESVKVRYRDAKTDKLDTIDLKYIGKQFKDKILEKDENINPDSEYVGSTIIGMYEGYEGTLSKSYEEFIIDMVTADFPKLQKEPNKESRVILKSVEK